MNSRLCLHLIAVFLVPLLPACAESPRQPPNDPTSMEDEVPPVEPEGAATMISEQQDAEPEAPPAACPEFPQVENIVRLEPLEEQIGELRAPVHRVVGVRGDSTAQGLLAIRAGFHDLNNDRRRDEKLVFGQVDAAGGWSYHCENSGECLQGWYLDCQDGLFAEVLLASSFEPLRAGSIRPQSGGGYWFDVVGLMRVEGEASETLEPAVWSHREGHYVRVESRGAAHQSSNEPSIETEEHCLDSSGIPAVSADGRQVAVVRCTSGYDESHENKLLLYRVIDGRHQRSILLSKSGSSGVGSTPEAAVKRAVNQANVVLKRGNFRPLRELHDPLRDGPHGRMTIAYGAGVRLRYDSSSTVTIDGALSWSGTLSGFGSSGQCCATLDDDLSTTCILPPVLTGAWLDPGSAALVLQYENYDGPDGCETETAFRIVRLSR